MGAMREASLTEYCQQLPSCHRVNKELKLVSDTFMELLDWIENHIEYPLPEPTDNGLGTNIDRTMDVLDELRAWFQSLPDPDMFPETDTTWENL